MGDLRSQLAALSRFVLVGIANTLTYYAVYRLLLLVLPYLPAHVLAYGVGIVFSFFANSLFTFGVRPTWRRFLAFPLTTVFNFVVVTAGSVLLVERGWLDERWATLVMTVVAIPVTFLLTRRVLTAGRAGRR
ncbi:GtrA family protein [Ornithinimicrobium flavum]|uniref:GtrA family protein n=1 Tax=Ornithinimicrobium flavum TaxID=1288636 RepID=UPI001EE93C67|nr:GtrA family protein [Ornithinimicrobium flavum]